MHTVAHMVFSKSKGQVLRVSAALHILFKVNQLEDNIEEGSEHDSSEDVEEEDEALISEEAIQAAINFVTTCCQQTAFIAGRDKIGEEIEIIQASKCLVLGKDSFQ